MSADAQKPDSATAMAQERTSLAEHRTLLAEERTLMAWIRTSVSLIGFGFTIYKFFEYLREAEEKAGRFEHGPRNLGLLLIAMGTLAAVAAALQYRAAVRALGVPKGRSRFSLPVAGSVTVALVGVAAFLSVYFGVGPF